MIVPILREGEWDPSFGGGTEVNRPKVERHRFNRVNRLAGFEHMAVLDTYEFTPNQGVVFVKTLNSWHWVRPMTGRGSNALRKTLTINIEEGVSDAPGTPSNIPFNSRLSVQAWVWQARGLVGPSPLSKTAVR